MPINPGLRGGMQGRWVVVFLQAEQLWASEAVGCFCGPHGPKATRGNGASKGVQGHCFLLPDRQEASLENASIINSVEKS